MEDFTDYIEFDHAANSQDLDYLEILEESAGQERNPFIGGGMSKICRACGACDQPDPEVLGKYSPK